MVAWDSQIKNCMSINIHNMPQNILRGLTFDQALERPNCSKVLVPLSKLSVSKNVWRDEKQSREEAERRERLEERRVEEKE